MQSGTTKPPLIDTAVTDNLEVVAMRVAQYAAKINFRRYENWENAIVAGGFLALDRAPYIDSAHHIIRHAIRAQDAGGQLAFNLVVPGAPGNSVERWSGKRSITGAVHSATMGPRVLYFYQRTGDETYLDAARRQYEYLRRLQRVANGGMIHREEGKELWVDSMWFIIPFLAEYGRITGNREAIEESALQIRAHADRLRDPRCGLFRHIWCETPDFYPQSTFWSRGNGWAITSFVDSYEHFPDDHPIRREIAEMTASMAAQLVRLQDRSGYWHNTLDDRLTPTESSGTLMLAYGLKKALDLGMIDGEEIRSSAIRAMGAGMLAVNEEGGVEYVTLPPGGPGAPLGVAPYGQGWFMFAASRFAGTQTCL